MKIFLENNKLSNKNIENKINQIKNKNGRNLTQKQFSNFLRKKYYGLFFYLFKKHHKFNEDSYTFPLLNINNSNKILIYNEIESKLLNLTFEETMIRLGLNKINFEGNRDDFLKNKVKIWLNQLFLPIKHKFNESDYPRNDYIMENLAFYLLYNKNKITQRNNSLNRTNYLRGAWGIPFSRENIFYKIEDLRYQQRSDFRKRFTYYKKNYQNSIYFIGFMIQNYMYTEFPKYFCNPHNIFFNYNEFLSETQMNLASVNFNKINNSEVLFCTIDEFLKKTEIFNRIDYIDLFFKIIFELSSGLYQMQDKCGFVHNDLHTKNIVISYQYENNNSNILLKNIKFELKIIDVTFSTIMIKNSNNQICLLKYYNIKPYRLPDLVNPLKSSIWNKLDLRMFILSILFFTFLMKYNKDENKFYYLNEEEIEPYLGIINKIIEIFNFNQNCIDLFKDIFKEPTYYHIFKIFSKKEIYESVLGYNINDNLFIPYNLFLYFV